MEETETPHPEYIKGFNEGYLLSKHMPDLWEQLAKAAGDSIRGKAFNDGRQEFILEQQESVFPAGLQMIDLRIWIITLWNKKIWMIWTAELNIASFWANSTLKKSLVVGEHQFV